jgi:hypothetical protein
MKAIEILRKVRDFYNIPGNLPAYDTELKACKYYMSDNQRCAVGCLLEPKQAKELQDKVGQKAFTNILSKTFIHPQAWIIQNLLLELIPEDMSEHEGKEFIADLQAVHDDESRNFVKGETTNFGTCLYNRMLLMYPHLQPDQVQSE